MSNAKALARYIYARVPGVAPLRFAFKDFATGFVSKPEFGGLVHIDDGLIVDVGANRGQSIAAFRRIKPECDIVAFEPEPSSAARTAARFHGDKNVVLHNCALGYEDGVLKLFMPKYGLWDCDGMASTSYDEAVGWLLNPGCMFRFDKTKLKVHEHTVECHTLDSFKLNPALIKLHTQGTELDILKGAESTLRKSKPALMVGFPKNEVTGFLLEFGYQPHVYDRGEFLPGCADPHTTTFTWFLREIIRCRAEFQPAGQQRRAALGGSTCRFSPLDIAGSRPTRRARAVPRRAHWDR
jgi:FkbM family methyltransferase